MKRIILSLWAVIISFSMSAGLLPVYAEEKDNEEFDEFLMDEFLDTMEADFLTMHYTLKDYRAMGVEKPEMSFGDASKQSYDDQMKASQESLDLLHEFDYDSLSVSQQHDYRIYERNLKQIIELDKYPLLDMLFNPYTGVVNNITTNLTEYVIYNEEDITDYLEVIKTIPEFLEQALDLTREQADAGIFMYDDLLDEGLDTIYRLTEKKDDNELIVVFNDSVDAFSGITDAKKEQYKKENRDTVLNVILPEFDHCAEVLESLRGSGKYSGGLANYPDGAAYYEALAQYKTSSEYTVQELLDLCTDYLDAVISDYYALYMTGQLSDDSVYDESVPERTPQEVLAYLQDHLQNYPDGPVVTYTSQYLDPSVANDSTVAYYVNPPIDDIKDNVIKINGSNVGDANGLYETLAHEGFPGHCYQITWYFDQDPHPARSIMGSIAYTEGWAMYSECEAYDFSGLSSAAAAINRIDTALGYVEDCAVDLGVNGLGWSVEDVRKYLQEIGMNADAAPLLYDFVLGRPGLLLPYGYGLLMMYNMRGKAEAALGDAFDLKDYHEVILTYGDRPFDLVEEDVDAYIQKKGERVPEEWNFHSLAGVAADEDIPPVPFPLPVQEKKNPAIYIGAVIFFGVVSVLAYLRYRKKKEEAPFA